MDTTALILHELIVAFANNAQTCVRASASCTRAAHRSYYLGQAEVWREACGLLTARLPRDPPSPLNVLNAPPLASGTIRVGDKVRGAGLLPGTTVTACEVEQ